MTGGSGARLVSSAVAAVFSAVESSRPLPWAAPTRWLCLGRSVACPVTGETRDLVRTGSTVWGLAVVPTGEGPEVVSGHEDGTVRATRLTGEIRTVTDTGSGVWGLAAVPSGEGTAVVSGHEDGTIRVTDLSGETRTVIDPGSPVMAVVGAETPDGFLLVAGTPQGIVALHTVAG